MAGSVRAKALATQRVGAAGARSLAAGSDLDTALDRLVDGLYGRELRRGQTLVEAQRAVTAAVLWHGRVLAGWLPRSGAQMMRVLAGWFEISNTDARLDSLAGAGGQPPFVLGSLASAWPRLSAAQTSAELRETMTASCWGDPGAADDRSVSFAMRLQWAVRVRAGIPGARQWACGAAALMIARELAAGRRLDAPRMLLRRAIDADVTSVASVEELVTLLPGDARWAIGSARSLEQLAAAETGWWARVETDAEAAARLAAMDSRMVVASVALLAVDARRVRAALSLAARGGAPLEVFDAVV